MAVTAAVAAAAPHRRADVGRRQPPWLFAGLAVASIGGPLALVALYLPGILADAGSAGGVATVGGVAAFAAPTLIWCRYSRRVAGPGGLFAFTAAAAGRRIALVQAGLWLVSYLLYLLYTSDYVVYDVLPAAGPGVVRWQPALAVALPVVVAAIVLAPLRVSLSALTVTAAAQLAVAVVVVALAAAHPITSAPRPAPSLSVATRAGGDVALLFVCASLPVFLGGEVAGGGRTVRRTLGWSVAGVGALVAVAAVFGSALRAFASADVPGVALARSFAGPTLAATVAVAVAASIMALVVVEYLAVTRLLHAVRAWSVPTVARALAVALVAGGVASLADPRRFYVDLLRPSMVALWLAQLLPVLVYPLFARRNAGLRRSDVIATVVSVALLVFGLRESLTASLGT